MKKLLILLMALFLIFSVNSCKKVPGEATHVVTTIYPVKLIINGMDSRRNVTALIKGASSPHDYSPKPSEIQKIQNTELFVRIGSDFDMWASELIKKNKIEVDSLKFIEDGEKVDNPHIWLSFKGTYEIISKLKPVLDEKFGYDDLRKNQTYTLKNDLKDLEEKWVKKFKNLDNNKIALYHPAWDLLFKELGLTVSRIIKENPHKKLSSKEVKEIIDLIKENNIKVIIGEIQHKDPLLKTIKDETDVTIVELNAIGSKENKDFVEFLDKNIKAVYNNLKKNE